VTGILGVMATLTDTLQVGASVRPPVPVAADGQLVITLGDLIKDTAKVNGDRASLFLTMPLEIKLGTHWKPLPELAVNVDVVYEGWDSFENLVIEPRGITQQVGNSEPVALDKISIPKKWRSTFGARAGVGYTTPFGLQVRAGALFEQQASDTKYFNIDFPNPQRLFLTGGVEYPVGPVQLLVTGAWTPTVTLDVTDSDVRQVTNNPAVPGNVVGNGVYTSGGWMASVGVRGNFGPQR
jgi:long-subunit fatty acid transport protein